MQSSQSHQVLARKWRPRDFESLVGQDTVVRALRHALDNDRLHHAYLLTGTRGVGKTTIARILAKGLNCETGVTSRPCGRCDACVGVDQGRFPDYVEMDAASNRKVEEMTVVLENAAYSPSIGRYKVFVIDEVHMLTNHAFNAMLKTLEEPPDHVVFVLATTDPQKVPVTVLSRCMQFGLRNMTPAAVSARLAYVLQEEKVPFDAPALELIARAAAGSMRDALSLLDQAIALGGGSVSLESVRDMLGAVDGQMVAQLLQLLAAGTPLEVISLGDEMAATNVPFTQLLMALARELQRVALAQLDPALAVDTPADGADAGSVARLAAAISPEDVQVWYQVAIHAARDLPLAPDPQTGFTMALVRMLAFKSSVAQTGAHTAGGDVAPQRSARAIAAPVMAAVPLPRSGPPAEGPRARPVDVRASMSTRSAEEATPSAPGASVQGAGAAVPSTVPVPGVPQDLPPGEPPSAPAPARGATADFDGDWSGLTGRLPGGGPARQFLQQSELLGFEGNLFRLRVPIKQLMEPAIVARATDILSKWYGTQVRLSVTLGATGDGTAAAKASQAREQRQSEATDAINSDPFVRELIKGFGATIMPDSIKPIEGDA
ncbi:MAG TPA: DNA polymerase III subunit gamma/tau [Lautropia sp.]|nr:DNA polymerase III subunit gamma/tau [Lautropia sp.]